MPISGLVSSLNSTCLTIRIAAERETAAACFSKLTVKNIAASQRCQPRNLCLHKIMDMFTRAALDRVTDTVTDTVTNLTPLCRRDSLTTSNRLLFQNLLSWGCPERVRGE